jgi:hypothetical protein
MNGGQICSFLHVQDQNNRYGKQMAMRVSGAYRNDSGYVVKEDIDNIVLVDRVALLERHAHYAAPPHSHSRGAAKAMRQNHKKHLAPAYSNACHYRSLAGLRTTLNACTF